MPVYQNIPSWWTETQGGNCATTRTSTLADLPQDYKDMRPDGALSQPVARGEVEPARRRRTSWSPRRSPRSATARSSAKTFCTIGISRAATSSRSTAPRDRSPTSSRRSSTIRSRRSSCCDASRFTAFASDQLDRDMAYNGTTYPKGTWVIPMDQEFASLVQEVFEVQHYPENARRQAVRRRRLDASLPDGRERHRSGDAAVGRVPRRAQAGAAGQGRRLAHRARCAAHDERGGRGHRARAPADSPEPAIRCCSIPRRTTRSRSWRAHLPRAASVAFKPAQRPEPIRPLRRRACQARRVGRGAVGHRRAHVGCVGRVAVSGSPPRIGLGNDGWTRVVVRHARREIHEGHQRRSASRQPRVTLRRARAARRPRRRLRSRGWRWRRRRCRRARRSRRWSAAAPDRASDARRRRIRQERRHRAHVGQRRCERRAGASASRYRTRPPDSRGRSTSPARRSCRCRSTPRTR